MVPRLHAAPHDGRPRGAGGQGKPPRRDARKGDLRLHRRIVVPGAPGGRCRRHPDLREPDFAGARALTELRREIGLWRGVALNMIDMVGIGPFITIPLILSAMGGGRAMLAWLLGALLAISDGLVTAELAAELPASGGTYVFLREAYGPERWGKLLAFLFLFQILI